MPSSSPRSLKESAQELGHNLDNLDDQQLKEAGRERQKQLDIDKHVADVMNLLNLNGNYISDKRRNELEKRILSNSITEKELAEAETEIKARSSNINRFVRDLDPNRDLFSEDPSKATTYEQHLEKFRDQSVTEQHKSLESLRGRIQDLKRLFQDCYQELGGEANVSAEVKAELRNLGKRGKEEWLAKHRGLKRSAQALQKTKAWKYLDKDSQKTLSERLNNFDHEALKILIEDLESSFRNEDLYKNYDHIQQLGKAHNYKPPKELSEFLEADDRGKRRVMEIVRIDLARQTKQRMNKYRDLFNETDKRFVDQFLEKDGIDSLAFHYPNSDPKHPNSYIQKLEKIAKYLEKHKFPPEVFQAARWEQLYPDERLAMINNGRLEKDNAIEHLKLDKQYDKRLTEFAEHDNVGLITKEGAKKYQKWFYSLSFTDKEYYLKNKEKDFLYQTRDQRIEQNKTYLKLPDKMQKEYKREYKKADFEGRGKLLDKVSTQNMELIGKYDKKIATSLAEKKITPKAAEEYEEWFAEESIKNKKRYLDKCDLDDKERDKLLKRFEELIKMPSYQKLSAKQQRKIETEFYEELNREGKEAKITELRKELLNDTEQEQMDALDAELDTDDEMEVDVKSEMEQQISKLDETAEKAINKGLPGCHETAIAMYEEILNMLSPETDRKLYKEYLEKLEDVKEEQKSLQALQKLDDSDNASAAAMEQLNPIEARLDELIETEINSNKLKLDKEHFTLLYLTHELIEHSELITQGLNVEERMKYSLERANVDQETLDYNQELINETDGDIQLTVDREQQVHTDEIVYFDPTYSADPKDPGFNREYANELEEIQRSGVPYEKRFKHNLAAVDPDSKTELTAHQFQSRILTPNRAQMERQIIDRIQKQLEQEFKGQPDLVNKLIERAMQKLMLEPDKTFVTKLPER